jgi:hypothetical protein
MNPRKPNVCRISHRQRGSVYLLVVGVVMLVTVMSVSGVMVARIQARTSGQLNDLAEAQRFALSAIELGRARVAQDANWRANNPNGVWIANQAIGKGTVSLEVTDPLDGNFTNRPHDGVLLRGTGRKGRASAHAEVALTAKPVPLPALGMAIHTRGQLHLRAGQSLKVTSAIASTNTEIRNDGTITGNVQALTSNSTGTVTGTTTLGVSPKAFPPSGVVTLYTNLGTVINPGNTIDRCVLSPASNPWGATNPDGVYVINSGADVTIKDSRIVGTLVINCPDKKVTITSKVLLQPARPDFPTLIVNGNAVFSYDSSGVFLSEASLSTNFNPPGTPYLGAANSNLLDQYPSEIQGLVHITGTLICTNTPLIRGLVLCESAAMVDAVDLSGTVEIVYNSNLYTNPPQGYTASVGMPVQSGSWRQPPN